DEIGEVSDRRAGARRLRVAALLDDPVEVVRAAVRWVGEDDGTPLALERVGPAGELHADALLDERDLRPRILGRGEAEAQQPLADERRWRPAVGEDIACFARDDVGRNRPAMAARRARRIQPHALE